MMKMMIARVSATAALSGVLALGSTVVFGPLSSSAQTSSPSSRVVVKCEPGEDGSPITTISRSGSSQGSTTIWHWGAVSGFSSEDPQQICKSASQQLQSFLDAGDQELYLASHLIDGKPGVCLEETAGTCGKVLFTLAAAPQDVNAPLSEINSILENIVDDSQKKPGTTQTRGDQPTRYNFLRGRLRLAAPPQDAATAPQDANAPLLEINNILDKIVNDSQKKPGATQTRGDQPTRYNFLRGRLRL